MTNLFARLLSHGADRQLKELRAITARVGDLGPTFSAMSDGDLRAQTVRLRERHDGGESLDELLPRRLPPCASIQRTLGMRHFDVQVIGGIALHRGMIAEMKTGEGRPSSRRSPATSTPSRARACTSSR